MRVPLTVSAVSPVLLLRGGSALAEFATAVSVSVHERGTETQATIYAAEAGGTTVAQPLKTDGAGRIEGAAGQQCWVEEGSYDLLIGATTVPWEAAAGRGVIPSGSPNAGDVLVYDGGAWARLTVGESGQQLIVRSDGTVAWVDPVEVSVDAWGADAGGDVSDAFDDAIAAAGVGGRVVGSRATYEIADVKMLDQQEFRGAGRGAGGTVLKAAAGAEYVLRREGVSRTVVEKVKIDGNAKAASGLLIRGLNSAAGSTAQDNVTRDAWVANCKTCVRVDGAGAADQVDKNTYDTCVLSDCEVGLVVASLNGQHQLLTNCDIVSCSKASIQMSGGTLLMVSGQMQQPGGNGITIEITGSGVAAIKLIDVITEGHKEGIRPTGANTWWPEMGVTAENCYLQAAENNVIVDAGGSIAAFTAKNCRINGGDIVLRGNDTYFYNERCKLGEGVEVTLTGAGTRMVETQPTIYTVGTAPAVSFANSWVNAEGGRTKAAYFMDSHAVVHLRGSIKSGEVGKEAFILPKGMRPLLIEEFPVVSITGAAAAIFARVTINSEGKVTISTPSDNNLVNLNGISFKAAL